MQSVNAWTAEFQIRGAPLWEHQGLKAIADYGTEEWPVLMHEPK